MQKNNPITIVIISLLIALSTIGYSQDCSVKEFSFKSGEKVTYKAVYNWGFIWLNAGEVLFAVSDTVYLNQPALHLLSKGWSLPRYDMFFKVRDRFESIVNITTLQPYWFERETFEGGFEVFNRYVFKESSKTLEIVSQTSDRPFKKEILPLKPCAFDVLSAIYYCRNLDFDKYKKGDRIPLTMVIDNEVFDLFIRYQGKERLKTRDGEVYNTIRFTAMLVEGTIFKGGEDLMVWVTDDKNRIPLMVEAKILVGSVKAVLTGMEGLKYPITSLVRD
jgi:hypothetical protein